MAVAIPLVVLSHSVPDSRAASSASTSSSSSPASSSPAAGARARRAGGISSGGFYARRARRILPAASPSSSSAPDRAVAMDIAAALRRASPTGVFSAFAANLHWTPPRTRTTSTSPPPTASTLLVARRRGAVLRRLADDRAVVGLLYDAVRASDPVRCDRARPRGDRGQHRVVRLARRPERDQPEPGLYPLLRRSPGRGSSGVGAMAASLLVARARTDDGSAPRWSSDGCAGVGSRSGSAVSR